MDFFKRPEPWIMIGAAFGVVTLGSAVQAIVKIRSGK